LGWKRSRAAAPSRGSGARDPSEQPVTARAAAADKWIVLLNPVFDESLIAELQRGERLLWSGRPDTSRWLVPEDLAKLPLSLGAAMFTILLDTLIVKSTIFESGVSALNVCVSLWGLLFAGLGVYVGFGRLIVRRYFGPRTVYGLTNLRALVIRPGWRGGRQMSFVWLGTRPSVNQRTGRDGHGTVMIGATIFQQWAWYAGDPGWFSPKSYERPLVAFWNIADAAEVSRLAARLIAEAQVVDETQAVDEAQVVEEATDHVVEFGRGTPIVVQLRWRDRDSPRGGET
jgi:hypothetical protein